MSDKNDFNIKPITQGLGFHRKTNPIELKIDKAKPVSPNNDIEETKKELSDLLSALDSITFKLDPDRNLDFVSEPAITEPVLEKKSPSLSERMNSSYTETKPLGYMALEKIKSRKVFKPITETPSKERRPTHSIISTQEGVFKRPLVGVRRSSADNPPPLLKYKPISIHIAADFIDGFFIAAVSVCFSFLLLALLEMMGESISLYAFFTDSSFVMKVFALFVLSHQVYLVTTRVFFGKTIGEWTTDCQVGTAKEKKKPDYVVRVVGRSLLMALTGFIVLPVLSILFRKDLAGAITGLQLYQKDI